MYIRGIGIKHNMASNNTNKKGEHNGKMVY